MAASFWYWGGFTDLERKLNSAKIDGQDVCVFTAAVGPFSSVWDRAVELFYQIKGRTVSLRARLGIHINRHSDMWPFRWYCGLRCGAL
jgi:triacylglycerol lipase